MKNANQIYAAIVLLVIVSVSGFATWLLGARLHWLQVLVLVHIVSGFAFGIVSVTYLANHFRLTVGFKRLGVLITGWLGLLGLLVALISGTSIVVFGVSGQHSSRLVLHKTSVCVFVAMVVAHLLVHWYTFPVRRRRPDGAVFTKQFTLSPMRVLAPPVLVLALIVLMLGLHRVSAIPEMVQPRAGSYTLPYGENKFAPSMTTTISGSFVHPDLVGDSVTCMSCHVGIGRQWLSSAHRLAAADPAYVKNITLLVKNKGIAAARYCEGCHAPVALLSGELSEGGQHGGIVGTVANDEGVSCLTCHAIGSGANIKGNGSFIFGREEYQLLENSSNKPLAALSKLITHTRPNAHKESMLQPQHKTAEFCASCHAQFMDQSMNDWGWVNMQNEYSAWLESPFSGRREQRHISGDTKFCQDCHMPMEFAADEPAADVNGKVRSHRFPGSNTFLPAWRGDRKQLETTIDFLTSGNMTVSIDRPNVNESPRSELAVSQASVVGGETSPFFYLGESYEINVLVSNVGVGHSFPGGTIDINEAWLEFTVVDASGENIFSTGLMDESGEVDPEGYFYRNIPVNSKGNHVWKHDLFNMIGETFSRVIDSGKSDIATFTIEVPMWARSPLYISAALNYRKLNFRYSSWVLGKPVQLPVVVMGSDSVVVPLKLRVPSRSEKTGG